MNILRYFVIEYSPVFNSSYSTPLTRTAHGPNAHAQYEIIAIVTHSNCSNNSMRMRNR